MPSHNHSLTAANFGRTNASPGPEPFDSELNRVEAKNRTLNSAISNTGGSGSHNHNAGHNLSGSISGSPDRGTLSGSLSSASASINVKYQDFIIAQKD
jgi:hypothetical protein